FSLTQSYRPFEWLVSQYDLEDVRPGLTPPSAKLRGPFQRALETIAISTSQRHPSAPDHLGLNHRLGEHALAHLRRLMAGPSINGTQGPREVRGGHFFLLRLVSESR